MSATRHHVLISSRADGLSFLGTRPRAQALREEVARLLGAGQDDVQVDFTGVAVSQSFADELLGPLLLQSGPDVLTRLVFTGCSDSVKAAIEFVVADRYDEFVRTRSH